MNIRTITVGAREEDIDQAARAAHAAHERLVAAGYTVQSIRLTLATIGSNRCADFPTVAQGVEELALEHGFDFVSLGRIDAERLPHLAEALASTEIVSASAKIAGRDGQSDGSMIKHTAEAIHAIAAHTAGGLGNLRFAAAACIGPGSPFFPISFHDGSGPWLAVGPEAAALAVQAITTGDQLPEELGSPEQRAAVARRRSTAHLTSLIEQHDKQIHSALAGLGQEHGVFVTGCDWSMAPQPDPACSIGAAIEALSGVPFGAWGTLPAVRAITDAIRSAKVNQIGFSGVMLPILEDATLAQRNNEGRYTLRDLLAFSAVCGTGLDTIPLPGDATVAQLAHILEEVAALAGALRKPLTARLLPMPGLHHGDMTRIALTHPQLAQFFCQTLVMALE